LDLVVYTYQLTKLVGVAGPMAIYAFAFFTFVVRTLIPYPTKVRTFFLKYLF
jgi:hypothetical protein